MKFAHNGKSWQQPICVADNFKDSVVAMINFLDALGPKRICLPSTLYCGGLALLHRRKLGPACS